MTGVGLLVGYLVAEALPRLLSGRSFDQYSWPYFLLRLGGTTAFVLVGGLVLPRWKPPLPGRSPTPGVLRPSDVLTVRFHPAPRGYDYAEVDAFLARAATAVAEWELLARRRRESGAYPLPRPGLLDLTEVRTAAFTITQPGYDREQVGRIQDALWDTLYKLGGVA